MSRTKLRRPALSLSPPCPRALEQVGLALVAGPSPAGASGAGPPCALLVADAENHAVRRVCLRTRAVATVAGHAGVAGFADGPARLARFHRPTGVAVAGDGTVFVADARNHRVREISPVDGAVSTLAGSGERAARDGVGRHAAICAPQALCLDERASLLYVTTGDIDPVPGGSHRVRAVTVPLPGQRRVERLFPIVRTWALVQAARARPAPVGDGARDARLRATLRLLMNYPVVDVLRMVLDYAYA